MTTGELIAALRRLDPSGKGNVEVPVGSYTKRYPSAYLSPFDVERSPHSSGENGVFTVRVYVSFPEGFQIREPKRGGLAMTSEPAYKTCEPCRDWFFGRSPERCAEHDTRAGQIPVRSANPRQPTEIAFERYLLLLGYTVQTIESSSYGVFGQVIGDADAKNFTWVTKGTIACSLVHLSYQDWRKGAITGGLMDRLH